MKELFNRICDSLEQGEPVVCATIFGSRGSSPRTSGAKMIIFKDKNIFGTVGGGRLESQVLTKSTEIFSSKKNITMHFDLNGLKETDMICGGEVEVLLEYLNPRDVDIYKTSLNSIEKNERAYFITSLNKENLTVNRYLYTYNNENIKGSRGLDRELYDKLKDSLGKKQLKTVDIDSYTYIIESISNNEVLYIFGAGHISEKLAMLTKMVDFKTVVIDDRNTFASRERFPSVDEIMVINSFDEDINIEIDEDTYMVLITRGHASDFKVMKQVLNSKAKYIGMIGSKRKRTEICSKLKAEGYVEEDFLRIHSPVGLEINADTPAEIAVSIAAELIKVRGENK
ncbi:xanthine and CO dehydrogenases maturation factor, XdhC/CoxF family [Clostridium pasteurianum DSM 525 = ATCC 6013]|uniref:Xanthine and CO dehydrogenases maturation factor, XdhC/CoxF family n=1 Tax=Clostridium pasteurianum DSM 525 = ATCC 6013 TaxID=1262449 RepID=A0A0H3IY08_CLOPA|nr:XdhC/CoxI family protein [Clostridium pasteurianum]AJA46381.1 xanthine and CO dehydrogenases maturation factor, XdhC/CoxF family [Clostridium pasteurianum DSM 525 = ATCC 6013]AJA50369.1 xanthine and CO dehydrogenases maturation factor, XdhC/CoxF family [Clostridium pasteurianum DSM 525 = ATCC 6013]AOZ73818.1 XshC-Cox1 family protein [Clostridium pasteurianum DSM 525 = ATCC 6013]AOZ77615.1 XshC-Cox1 family protein [Clostridium pasteurianum]ELP60956.1 XshC-Cox1 family protein [Clostridium pas